MLGCFCLISCDKYDILGMIAGSSPTANARFAESEAYNDANGFRTFRLGSNDYKVYAAADAHLSNTNRGMHHFVETYLADNEAAPFALFLGDALDGNGDFDLFSQIVASVAADGRALLCTPGNHDINFGLWKDYLRVNKTATYLFEVVTLSEGKDLFISLDSSSGTLGADQRIWLGEILAASKGKYRHIIIFTHTYFFKKSSSSLISEGFNTEESFDLEKLFSDSGVELVLSGHGHDFSETIFKNVQYLTLAAIKDGSESCFYSIDVGTDSIQWDRYEIAR